MLTDPISNRTVSQCSIQLMQIINDIIDFSKLSSGNMRIT